MKYTPKRKEGGGRSKLTPLREGIILTQMLARRKGRPREALIDGLTNKQMKGIGKAFGKFLRMQRQLPGKRLKQLIRDQRLVNAVIQGHGPLNTRKKILKQKGGFLGALLPLAAKTLGPMVLGPLAGKVIKKILPF